MSRAPVAEVAIAVGLTFVLIDIATPLDLAEAAGKRVKKAVKEATAEEDKGGWREYAEEGDYSHYAAQFVAKEYGWKGKEWVALWKLWQWESGWNPEADNPNSSAYGIAQCLTELHDSCNATYVTDWQYQIHWGAAYIANHPNYGKPSEAWRLHQSRCGTPEGCWYATVPISLPFLVRRRKWWAGGKRQREHERIGSGWPHRSRLTATDSKLETDRSLSMPIEEPSVVGIADTSKDTLIWTTDPVRRSGSIPVMFTVEHGERSGQNGPSATFGAMHAIHDGTHWGGARSSACEVGKS